MTSVKDLIRDGLSIGRTVEVKPKSLDGRLVAEHPHENAPIDITVVDVPDPIRRELEDTERRRMRVEITGRIDDGRIVGRYIESEKSDPDA